MSRGLLLKVCSKIFKRGSNQSLIEKLPSNPSAKGHQPLESWIAQRTNQPILACPICPFLSLVFFLDNRLKDEPGCY